MLLGQFLFSELMSHASASVLLSPTCCSYFRRCLQGARIHLTMGGDAFAVDAVMRSLLMEDCLVGFCAV